MTANTLAATGAILAGIAVGTGAFGAHGLKNMVTPERLAVWETAARYHLIHSVALVALAALHVRLHAAAAGVAAWLFIAGIGVFSGSLYALVLTDTRWLGAVTPFGGLALMGGWLALAWAALKGP